MTVSSSSARRRFPKPGEVGTRCRNHCFRRNLVMRAVRDAMVMSPPLTTTREQIDEIVDLARSAVDDTAADLGIG